MDSRPGSPNCPRAPSRSRNRLQRQRPGRRLPRVRLLAQRRLRRNRRHSGRCKDGTPRKTLAWLMVLFIGGNLISAALPQVWGNAQRRRRGRPVPAIFMMSPGSPQRTSSASHSGPSSGRTSAGGPLSGPSPSSESSPCRGILAFIKPHPAAKPTNLRLELKAFTNVPVWLSILVTVFGFGARTYYDRKRTDGKTHIRPCSP